MEILNVDRNLCIGGLLSDFCLPLVARCRERGPLDGGNRERQRTVSMTRRCNCGGEQFCGKRRPIVVKKKRVPLNAALDPILNIVPALTDQPSARCFAHAESSFEFDQA